MHVGGDGILQRDFILGEKKYIKFKATSCDNTPVVVTEATYELHENGSVVDSGGCIVNGSQFMVLLEPKKIGSFMLEVDYTIAPEVRKVRVAINVT